MKTLTGYLNKTASTINEEYREIALNVLSKLK